MDNHIKYNHINFVLAVFHPCYFQKLNGETMSSAKCKMNKSDFVNNYGYKHLTVKGGGYQGFEIRS
jgi:hypothetical protein